MSAPIPSEPTTVQFLGSWARDGDVLCLCGTRAVRRTSHKNNSNFGQEFYCCSKAIDQSCKTFLWVKNLDIAVPSIGDKQRPPVKIEEEPEPSTPKASSSSSSLPGPGLGPGIVTPESNSRKRDVRHLEEEDTPSKKSNLLKSHECLTTGLASQPGPRSLEQQVAHQRIELEDARSKIEELEEMNLLLMHRNKELRQKLKGMNVTL